MSNVRGSRRLHDPLAAKFSSPEERRRYFSAIGKASNARRIILNSHETEAMVSVHRRLRAGDADALIAAYDLIARIASRHPEHFRTDDDPAVST